VANSCIKQAQLAAILKILGRYQMQKMQIRTQIIKIWHFWHFLIKRFLEDGAGSIASSLTFTTLFAVVPMLTVIFVFIAAIPEFKGVGEQIQNLVLGNVLPDSGIKIQEYLVKFSHQAKNLTWVGIIFIGVTSLGMLISIEKAFNKIWRVRIARHGVGRFLLYWAVLSLGPLLLGAGFTASTYLTSVALLLKIDTAPILKFAPFMFTASAFTFIYMVIPNTKVAFKHAVIGGSMAAMCFEFAKWCFGLYVRTFPSYQLIYGAFATVPLFLLWIYVSWLIVLFGAQLVSALGGSWSWQKRNLPKILVVLSILRIFAQKQTSGELVSVADLRRRGFILPDDEWHEIFSFLESQKLICKTANANFVLARNLDHYLLQDLISASPWNLPNLDQLPLKLDEPWYQDFYQALQQLQQFEQQLFSESISLWLKKSAV